MGSHIGIMYRLQKLLSHIYDRPLLYFQRFPTAFVDTFLSSVDKYSTLNGSICYTIGNSSRTALRVSFQTSLAAHKMSKFGVQFTRYQMVSLHNMTVGKWIGEPRINLYYRQLGTGYMYKCTDDFLAQSKLRENMKYITRSNIS